MLHGLVERKPQKTLRFRIVLTVLHLILNQILVRKGKKLLLQLLIHAEKLSPTLLPVQQKRQLRQQLPVVGTGEFVPLQENLNY
jgi:hypothetical protein